MEKAYVEKRFFRDLDTETKINIVMNNNSLKEKVGYDLYERNMEMQAEDMQLMLGNGNNGIEIRDYYSTFYLILTDWHKFLNSIDKDYLSNDGILIYHKIMRLKEEYDNTDMYSDRFNKLEDDIEDLCKDLLSICEEMLHQYENIDDDDLKEELRYEFEDYGLFDDYYIIEDDTTKVYNDVSYTETFE